MAANFPTQARVVIIGGGIMGCSTAYHLAKLGWKDVVLLEQGRLSGGTTWHAAGLVGQLRSYQNLTRLIRYSTELYSKLEAETGLATGWKQCGSLSVARTEERMVLLRRSAAMANAQGVDCEPLTPKQAGEKYPIMRTDDLVGAVWLPGDGKANPADITQALARGARTGGVRIFEKTRVTAVDTKDGRVTGVQTTEGPITAEIVVNCAGQWARQLGRMVGVTVPLYSCEHMYIVTEKMEDVPRDLPVMRDPDGYIYFKEEVGGLLMGGFEPGGQAVEQGHHPRRFRVRHAAGRLGPVPDPDGQRADPRAGAGEDRHQDLHERPGELHARPQLHPGRGAAAEGLLRRRGLQLDGHRQLGRRRHGAGRMDRGRRADARSVAGRHPPLRRLPRQRCLAARPRRRDARPALQDGRGRSASRRAAGRSAARRSTTG